MNERFIKFDRLKNLSSKELHVFCCNLFKDAVQQLVSDEDSIVSGFHEPEELNEYNQYKALGVDFVVETKLGKQVSFVVTEERRGRDFRKLCNKYNKLGIIVFSVRSHNNPTVVKSIESIRQGIDGMVMMASMD